MISSCSSSFTGHLAPAIFIFHSARRGLMPRLKCLPAARARNGRSSVSSDGINRRWIPGGWCMIHREPHRATPRATKWCARCTRLCERRGARVSAGSTRERTRDRGLGVGGRARYAGYMHRVGEGARAPMTGGVACCYLNCS